MNLEDQGAQVVLDPQTAEQELALLNAQLQLRAVAGTWSLQGK